MIQSKNKNILFQDKLNNKKYAVIYYSRLEKEYSYKKHEVRSLIYVNVYNIYDDNFILPENLCYGESNIIKLDDKGNISYDHSYSEFPDLLKKIDIDYLLELVYEHKRNKLELTVAEIVHNIRRMLNERRELLMTCNSVQEFLNEAIRTDEDIIYTSRMRSQSTSEKDALEFIRQLMTLCNNSKDKLAIESNRLDVDLIATAFARLFCVYTEPNFDGFEDLVKVYKSA